MGCVGGTEERCLWLRYKLEDRISRIALIIYPSSSPNSPPSTPPASSPQEPETPREGYMSDDSDDDIRPAGSNADDDKDPELVEKDETEGGLGNMFGASLAGENGRGAKDDRSEATATYLEPTKLITLFSSLRSSRPLIAAPKTALEEAKEAAAAAKKAAEEKAKGIEREKQAAAEGEMEKLHRRMTSKEKKESRKKRAALGELARATQGEEMLGAYVFFDGAVPSIVVCSPSTSTYPSNPTRPPFRSTGRKAQHSKVREANRVRSLQLFSRCPKR